MERKNDTEIILVHGLWFGSWAMFRLARSLGKASGLPVRRVNYRTTSGELTEHAIKLRRFTKQSGAGSKHFVGHSLGGLVVLKMLSDFDDIAPGRLVFLGSPLHGSAVARKLERIPGAAVLLGKIRSALEQGYPAIPGGREAGMIAGSKSMGLGWVVGGTEGPGDGTVAIAETVAEGLKDHCVLPVTHTGMLYSVEVVEKTAQFLETGAFDCANA